MELISLSCNVAQPEHVSHAEGHKKGKRSCPKKIQGLTERKKSLVHCEGVKKKPEEGVPEFRSEASSATSKEEVKGASRWK
jgi:hypothetical protein